MFQKRNKLHLSAVFLKLVLSRPLLLHGMYEFFFLVHQCSVLKARPDQYFSFIRERLEMTTVLGLFKTGLGQNQDGIYVDLMLL